MFIGHFGVALAGKRIAPNVSLGTLILAAQFVDLLWPVLLLAGLEHVRIDPGNTSVTPLDFYDYPITHSLLTSFGWAIIVGGTMFFFRRDVKSAMLISLLLLSHWFLDFLTHRPDLPLAPGSDVMFGLGLWNSVVWTMVVEVGIFAIGIVLYVQARGGLMFLGWGFWTLIGFLLLVWVGNIFGPPPPGEKAIGIAGLALWLLVPLGHAVDKRTVKRSSS